MYGNLFRSNFEKIKIDLHGHAGINYTSLKTYLEQKSTRALY